MKPRFFLIVLASAAVMAVACAATPLASSSEASSLADGAAPAFSDARAQGRSDALKPASPRDARAPDAATERDAAPFNKRWALVGAETASGLVGVSSADLTTLRCPAGFVVTGFEADWQAGFHALALHCRKVEGQGAFPGFGSEITTAIVKAVSNAELTGSRDCLSGAVVRQVGSILRSGGRIAGLAPVCEGPSEGLLLMPSFGGRVALDDLFTDLRVGEVAVGADVYVSNDSSFVGVSIGGLRLRTQKLALIDAL